MELAYLSARLDPKLVDERPARRLVGIQRLRLPAAPVEGEHQLPAQALTQRMLRHERLQLPCQLGIPTRVQILLDPLLEAGEVEILQTRDLGLGETAVGEVGERRASPEGERLRRPAALLQLAKALQIELVPHDTQQIAGRPRLHPLFADQLAQP